MPARKTAFNPKWKEIYPWLNSVPDDNFKAYCKHCKQIFSVAGKGEGCIKEHAARSKHIDAVNAACTSHSMHRFFSSRYQF